MPWRIQSVVGERSRLVGALLQNEKSVVCLCRHFGISRKTAYKWKARFTRGGRQALRDRSRRPRRMPAQLAGRWINRIRRLHKQRPHWGPKKIRARFQQQGWEPPSARTIARWFKRLALTRPQRRRPRKACVRKHPFLTVARRPTQIWTVNVIGWFRAGNGERCKV